jgi:hypothetical protein
LSAVGSSLQVEFPVVVGRYYSVWSATDAAGPWTEDAGSFRATGTGNYTLRVDSPTDATKFYRLRTEL